MSFGLCVIILFENEGLGGKPHLLVFDHIYSFNKATGCFLQIKKIQNNF